MDRKTIAIIDIGNLHSLMNALQYVCSDNVTLALSHNPKVIADSDAVVFPGQGAAESCMAKLTQHQGFAQQILNASTEKPFLGICMGMQVLMTQSEENKGVTCLDKIAGTVKPFLAQKMATNDGLPLKIPHMGWNSIRQTKAHPMWHNIPNHSHFYFVHSYYCDNLLADYTAGITDYGQTFTSVLAHDNCFAIQAHPEKSGDIGLRLLENFIQML